MNNSTKLNKNTKGGYRCYFPCIRRFQSRHQFHQHIAKVLECKHRHRAFIAEKLQGRPPSPTFKPDNGVENQDIGIEWETVSDDPTHLEAEDDILEVEELEGSNIDEEEEVTNMPARPREPCDEDDTFVVKYDGAGKIIAKEKTPFSVIYNLQKERNKGTYYPFSCQKEVELAEFLHESGMSQATIDQFMKLEYVGFLRSTA